MKLILLVFIGFFLSITTPVQNKANVTEDPIIGSWKIEKIIYINSDETSHDEIPKKCSNSKLFQYNADGTLFFSSFQLNNDTNECTIPSNDHWEGTWKKTYTGNYIRTLTYKYSEKIQSHYVDSVGIFIFSDHNKIMTQIKNYKSSGIAIDSTSKLISEHIIFKKAD